MLISRCHVLVATSRKKDENFFLHRPGLPRVLARNCSACKSRSRAVTQSAAGEFHWLRDVTRRKPEPLSFLYKHNLEAKAHICTLPGLESLKHHLEQLSVEAVVRQLEHQHLLPPDPLLSSDHACQAEDTGMDLYGGFYYACTTDRRHLRSPAQHPGPQPVTILDEKERSQGRPGYHLHALVPSPDFTMFAFR